MSQTSIFHFPTHEISNDRIKLIPFKPDHHGPTFINHTTQTPTLFSHMNIDPWSSLSDLKSAFYTSHDRHILSYANPDSFAYAIIDKTRPPSSDDAEGELAGTISYIKTSPVHLSTELGFVVVFPPFQKSHVAVNAVGLMLLNAFEAKEDGGLGLGRVHWMASTMNPASVRLAEKMGFERVGVTRWHMRFPKGAVKGKVGNGRGLPPRSDPEDLWRDTVELSLSWEEWLGGGDQKVRKVMNR
jgi:RimJ/RimL family protein N-acetyltransferase